MSIDHGRLDILMTQQLLHRANVIAGFEKVCGKAMTKRVRRYGFIDLRQAGSLFDRLLQTGLIQVMTPPDTCDRIC